MPMDGESKGWGFGLKNLGNTCYINCALQLLYHIVPLKNAVLSSKTIFKSKSLEEITEYMTRKEQILPPQRIGDCEIGLENLALGLKSLQELFQDISDSARHDAFDPSEFIDAIGYSHYAQDDAVNSVWIDLFVYYIEFVGAKHHIESTASVNDTKHSIIVVQPDQQHESLESSIRNDDVLKLQASLLPSILLFHVERTRLDSSGQPTKNNRAYHVPHSLDPNLMESLCNQSGIDISYHLRSFITHVGEEITGGHYVTHVKNFYNKRWYRFDDTHVKVYDFGDDVDRVMFENYISQAVMTQYVCSSSLALFIDDDRHTILDSQMLRPRKSRPKAKIDHQGVCDGDESGNDAPYLLKQCDSSSDDECNRHHEDTASEKDECRKRCVARTRARKNAMLSQEEREYINVKRRVARARKNAMLSQEARESVNEKRRVARAHKITELSQGERDTINENRRVAKALKNAQRSQGEIDAINEKRRVAKARKNAQRSQGERVSINEKRRVAKAQKNAQRSQGERESVNEKRRVAKAQKKAQQTQGETESVNEKRRVTRSRKNAELSQGERDSLNEKRRAAWAQKNAQLSQGERDTINENRRVARARKNAELSQGERDSLNEKRRAAWAQKNAQLSQGEVDSINEKRRVARMSKKAQLSRREKDALNEKRRLSRASKRRRSCNYQSTHDEEHSMRMSSMKTQPNTNDMYQVPCISATVIDSEKAIANGIKYATRTHRANNIHQATVCVICDRVIIGVEKVSHISKRQILDNAHRLSVDTFESFFGFQLNPILRAQYEVDDVELHGLLLSPRSYKEKNEYECCESCRLATRPSVMKDAGTKPPKHAIANGFAIGHLPSELYIEGEQQPRRTNITNASVSDIMNAAVALQRPYSFIFAFMGGAHKSVIGQYSFFESSHEHLGGALNHYRSTGANDHILVVLAGRFTPQQKEIARSQARLDTGLYIDLITWLIKTAKHKGFKNITAPEHCDVPREIDDSHHNNIDKPQDPIVENAFSSSFTFTSSQDPSENSSVYRDPIEFKVAMLNQESPLALISGGKFIGSGKELLLENIYPLIFPFGIGGPKMKRPTQISEIECYKHYLRMSLPQFMRGDFLLVVLHMYNRLMSYQRGVITCRAGRINGKQFGDVISTLTEDEIKKAAQNLSKNLDDKSIASQFLKKSEASCKAIAYTSAAARENRRIMYSFCDKFGIPGVFFTLTPCDECSFRVRLWASAGMQLTMIPIDCPDTECLIDFQLRRTARLAYPGACALEYQSVVQIALKVLFGWDVERQQGGKGIMGELDAYAIAHEEQGRKTLHGHWLLWIRGFNKLRQMLFHSKEVIQEKARKELIHYADKIMSSSFGEYEVNVVHTCGRKDVHLEENPTLDEADAKNVHVSTIGTIDDLFYDYLPDSVKKKEQLQHIRDARHKHHALDINGKLLHCHTGTCQDPFSVDEIIDMAIQYHLETSGTGKTHIPLHKNRLDRAIYGYPYDYAAFGSSNGFFSNGTLRSILLHYGVNQHDPMHRKACFKKGDECKHKLPDKSCLFTCLDVEEVNEDKSNVTSWYRLTDDGSGISLHTTPYLVQTRRPMGCQYMNTHSIEASAVFGCNTNVQIGDPNHLYYSTLYSSKNTQKDDSDRFIRIGTCVCKRLMRMRSIAKQKALDAAIHDSMDENVSESATSPREENWTEGLSRTLSGMCANLSKAVCSSPMAHLVVSNNGSRFEYSHDQTNLLVSQAIDLMDGKHIDCRIRTNLSKGKKVFWSDSAINDYLHRPIELENVCFYEYNAKYEKICKSWRQIKEQQQLDDDTDTPSKRSQPMFPFAELHPGYEFCHLVQRRFEVVPMLYLPEDHICRIKYLEVNSDEVSQKVKDMRERYAKASLVMFLPFRNWEDLQECAESDTQSFDSMYWSRFKREMDEGGKLWRPGIDILHNIEDRETAHNMKRATQPLMKETELRKCEDEDSPNKKSKEDDPDAIDFSLFDLDEERDIDLDYRMLEGYTKYTHRTHNHLIDSSKVDGMHIISARLSGNNSLLINEEEAVSSTGCSNDKDCEMSTMSERLNRPDTSMLVKFMNGALIGGSYDIYSAHDDVGWKTSCEGDVLREMPLEDIHMPTMIGIARMVADKEGIKLDEKQYAAYEIISSSFLLHLLEERELDPGSVLQSLDQSEIDSLIARLKAKGGHSQLIMFLSGFAGAGKSSCVKVAQRFCFEFCRIASIPWSTNTFLFTSTTGSSAALFDGMTIHDAAFLNGIEKNISMEKRRQWQDVHLLIIDEISFFTRSNLEKLDRHLKNIMGRYDKPYGGVPVVFTGDFHQLRPVGCDKEGMLYEGVMNGLFEGSINVAIFLEISHRFDDDPLFGDLLMRLWKGELTEQDIDLLNTRVVGCNGVSLPSLKEDSDITYACSTNAERNSISASIFLDHLHSGQFPRVNSKESPPCHTIIIEADIQSSGSSESSKKTRVSPEICDRILSTCGDSDCTTSQNKRIDPCLRLYPGAHAMCIDNSKLKSDNVGNGTLSRAWGVMLKKEAPPLQWKNWDGYKVPTVNIRYVEYLELERFPYTDEIQRKIDAINKLLEELAIKSDIEKQSRLETLQAELRVLKKARCFRVTPVKSTVTVRVSLDDAVSEKVILKGVVMTQLPINMNDATTGHKLQGMSKNKLIVVSWGFRFPNWVYVVLSRVRTLMGLYLLKPLPKDALDKFEVPRELEAFERRMRILEHHILAERKRYANT